MKNPKRIGIYPRNGLRLSYWNCDDETAQRFAAVFRATWLQIPTDARRAMIADWRAFRSAKNYPARMPFPSVSIDRYLDNQEPGKMPLGAFYGMYGRKVQFWAPAVEKMPDNILAALIAHELAHAYLKATGEAELFEADFFESADFTEELAVWEVMEDWRFYDDEITDWIEENREYLRACRSEL